MCTWLPNNLQIFHTLFVQNGPKNAICWTSIETENMLYFCFEFTIRCCEQNVLILYMYMTPKYSSNIWGTICTEWTTQTQYIGLTLKPTICFIFKCWTQHSTLRAKCLHSVCVHVSQIISNSLIHHLYKMEHTNTIFWIDIETTNMFHFAGI